MSYIMRLDKAIFYCLCVYALTSCIAGGVADKVIGVGVLVGLLRCIKERPRICIPQEYIRALLGFFGVLFMLVFISDDMRQSVREYWRFLNRMFPFLLAVFFLSNRRQIIWIGVCLLVSVTINNGYAIYTQIALLQSQGLWGRASGFDTYAINLAGILLLTIPSVAILLLANKLQWMKKSLLTLVFVISCITLFMNGTRIAWGIAAAILLLVPFFFVKSRKKAIIFGCLGLVCCTVMIGSIPAVHDRVVSVFDTQERSNRGHYFITRDSLRLIEDHPVLGVGLGRFQQVFNESYISPQTKEVEKFVTHTHDNTLYFLTETGIVGATAFWYMFGCLLFYPWREWKNNRSTSALIFFFATLAVTLQGITDYSFGLHPVMKIYYLMLAMYLKYMTCEKVKEQIG